MWRITRLRDEMDAGEECNQFNDNINNNNHNSNNDCGWKRARTD